MGFVAFMVWDFFVCMFLCFWGLGDAGWSEEVYLFIFLSTYFNLYSMLCHFVNFLLLIEFSFYSAFDLSIMHREGLAGLTD